MTIKKTDAELNTETNEPIKDSVRVTFGEFFINDKPYKFSYTKDLTIKPKSFNELFYSRACKIAAAVIVSSYFGNLSATSVAVPSLAYLFGERLLPVLILRHVAEYVIAKLN